MPQIHSQPLETQAVKMYFLSYEGFSVCVCDEETWEIEHFELSAPSWEARATCPWKRPRKKEYWSSVWGQAARQGRREAQSKNQVWKVEAGAGSYVEAEEGEVL